MELSLFGLRSSRLPDEYSAEIQEYFNAAQRVEEYTELAHREQRKLAKMASAQDTIACVQRARSILKKAAKEMHMASSVTAALTDFQLVRNAFGKELAVQPEMSDRVASSVTNCAASCCLLQLWKRKRQAAVQWVPYGMLLPKKFPMFLNAAVPAS